MGGRVDDFAVVESDPRIIYVGAAAGGIFKTVNGGVTWRASLKTSRIPPSAMSRWRRRILPSFTSAPASRITGRARPGATAFTSRWTAARLGRTWA